MGVHNEGFGGGREISQMIPWEIIDLIIGPRRPKR